MSGIDPEEQARINALVDAKSTRAVQDEVAERIAQRLAHHAAVWATDCDGVIFPFLDDPGTNVATPAGIRGYKDVLRLKFTKLVAVTGGALARSIKILTGAGLRTPPGASVDAPLDIYSTYGVEESVWDGTRYVEASFVPAGAQAKLDSAMKFLHDVLKEKLGVEEPFASSPEEANAHGRIYVELKAGMNTLHTVQAKGLTRPLYDVMHSEPVRQRLAELGLHEPKDNGSWEVGVDIIIDGERPHKGRVLRKLRETQIDGQAIDTLLYCADDKGDRTAIAEVKRFGAEPGHEGFVLGVHHGPEYFDNGDVKRPGSPEDVMADSNVIFRSESDLGKFLVRVVQRVFELDPNALTSTRVAAHAGLGTLA